jgi:hypothetical protein
MWKLGLRPRNPEKEYIKGIFVAVYEYKYGYYKKHIELISMANKIKIVS